MVKVAEVAEALADFTLRQEPLTAVTRYPVGLREGEGLTARTHRTVTVWLALTVVTAVGFGTDLLRVAAELSELVTRDRASDTSTA